MELKNCPFCGSAARMVTTKRIHDELFEENGRACIVIECKNLGCGATYFHHSDSTDYDTKHSESVERWNHRAEVETSKEM